MKKQQGVAAIILVLVLIPLFGSVFFALEGTRYIQKKTRLADAAEAAALAITDQNPNKLNIYTNANTQDTTIIKGSDIKAKIAKDYIDDYVRNTLSDKITITPEVLINNNKNDSYFQYNVDAKTTHNSWFFSKLIPSFNKTQDITAAALARNYPRLTGDQPIDLVFVADFSGSMQGEKIKSLKKSIKIISKKILNKDKDKDKDYKKNRIAFVAFSSFISNLNKEKKHVKYHKKTSITCDNYDYDYDYDYDYVNNMAINNKYKDKYKYLNSIYDGYDIEYKNRRHYRTCYFKYKVEDSVLKNVYFDYRTIILNLNSYQLKHLDIFNLDPEPIKDLYYIYDFYNIPLNKKNIIKKVNNMTPKGSTAAFNGIISGAKLLDKGNGIKNYRDRKKILILLSDGEESEPDILKKLVNNKLCDNIREHFSTDNNKMFMGMVGIGYRASDNDVFHKCFDGIYETEHHLITDSNIIDVNDLSTLTDKIKELIRKGQQTDGISKLSDGQN